MTSAVAYDNVIVRDGTDRPQHRARVRCFRSRPQESADISRNKRNAIPQPGAYGLTAVEKPAWNQSLACQMVSAALEQVAAEHERTAGLFDAGAFSAFDMELAAAFAARDMREVEALCRWYPEEGALSRGKDQMTPVAAGRLTSTGESVLDTSSEPEATQRRR